MDGSAGSWALDFIGWFPALLVIGVAVVAVAAVVVHVRKMAP